MQNAKCEMRNAKNKVTITIRFRISITKEEEEQEQLLFVVHKILSI